MRRRWEAAEAPQEKAALALRRFAGTEKKWLDEGSAWIKQGFCWLKGSETESLWALGTGCFGFGVVALWVSISGFGCGSGLVFV